MIRANAPVSRVARPPVGLPSPRVLALGPAWVNDGDDANGDGTILIYGWK